MEILVVDDEELTRQQIRETLEHVGHEVLTAPNGYEAYRIFRKKSVPILVADWSMPEMDGLELTRKIRAAGREEYTYVILLTGHSGKENNLKAYEAGVDDFMDKPFDAQLLLARIRVAQRILDLQIHIRSLEYLLPICCYCKKIRDENESWCNIESYISARTDTTFSHGICPGCYDTTVQGELDKLEAPAEDIEVLLSRRKGPPGGNARGHGA
ncbi:MAG: response regulator [Planctomycetota bacterium]|nr:response regulator [Planctomycetota bacterium]